MDDPGFRNVPEHYKLHATVDDPNPMEAIDLIRQEMGDTPFIHFCIGCAIKYRLRAGKKGPATLDREKGRWYEMMAIHVQGLGPDPRSSR